MMTPDQISQLAEVRADYKHIMEALRKVQEQLERQSDELQSMRTDIEKLKGGSPASIWDVAVKISAGLLAFYGAWQLISKAAG